VEIEKELIAFKKIIKYSLKAREPAQLLNYKTPLELDF